MVIPAEWRRGWVVLLPKPNKPPTEPKALRPIALQTPLSKTIMSLFVQHAKHFALPGLVWYPQFAYLPGRGTWEAIARVTAHVREVQSMLARWKYSANAPAVPRCMEAANFFSISPGPSMPCLVNTFGMLSDYLSFLTTSFCCFSPGTPKQHTLYNGRVWKQNKQCSEASVKDAEARPFFGHVSLP